jgi:hypothetical protein
MAKECRAILRKEKGVGANKRTAGTERLNYRVYIKVVTCCFGIK